MPIKYVLTLIDHATKLRLLTKAILLLTLKSFQDINLDKRVKKYSLKIKLFY